MLKLSVLNLYFWVKEVKELFGVEMEEAKTYIDGVASHRDIFYLDKG